MHDTDVSNESRESRLLPPLLRVGISRRLTLMFLRAIGIPVRVPERPSVSGFQQVKPKSAPCGRSSESLVEGAGRRAGGRSGKRARLPARPRIDTEATNN